MSNRLWENKETQKDREQILDALGRIVAAYVSHHTIEPQAVTTFIHHVFSALSNLNPMAHSRSTSQPVVDIDQSITPEYLICLEDGKRLKMLKRHLRTSYGLTPEQYRERWGLPLDYPMVAPNYAKKRSSLAKTNGLGHARSKVLQHPSAAAVS